jgi:5-formyltetrahydrofolate cyclo-ligase
LLKSPLRKQIIAARDALDPALRRDLSSRITARLLALPSYRDARCVMAYMSLGSEFDTAAYVADLRASGKDLVLPRVARDTRSLRLHRVRNPDTELAAGVWGIREPRADVCPEVAASVVDFILVPGVGFTARCERLGYGAGYYDRLIGALARRPALVAGAFGMQVVGELPMTASDQLVDLVVTEDAEHGRGS